MIITILTRAFGVGMALSLCMASFDCAPKLRKTDGNTPVANAGLDATINSDRYHLNGSKSSYDSTCNILWTQISGSVGAKISHPTTAITPIIDLNMGVYTFRLTLLNHEGATSSDEVVIKVLSQQGKDKVDDYITNLMDSCNVKGMSVAIIDGGKIVKVKGYGFTDEDRMTPVTPLTLFQVASMSKSFTAHGFGYWNDSTAKLGVRLPVPWKWNNYPEKVPAGLLTTAGDVALYVMDIQNTYADRSSKVVTKDMVDKMLTPVPGNQWKMGLGMVLEYPDEINAMFRSSGTNVGFQGMFRATVQTGQGVVVLYNDRMNEMFPELVALYVSKEYGWPKLADQKKNSEYYRE